MCSSTCTRVGVGLMSSTRALCSCTELPCGYATGNLSDEFKMGRNKRPEQEIRPFIYLNGGSDMKM